MVCFLTLPQSLPFCLMRGWVDGGKGFPYLPMYGTPHVWVLPLIRSSEYLPGLWGARTLLASPRGPVAQAPSSMRVSFQEGEVGGAHVALYYPSWCRKSLRRTRNLNYHSSSHLAFKNLLNCFLHIPFKGRYLFMPKVRQFIHMTPS
jgi:hypothetical protein